MNPNEIVAPPDALLAVPTNYRNYATDGSTDVLDGSTSASSNEFSLLDEGCARDVVIQDSESEAPPSMTVAEDPEGKHSKIDRLDVPSPVKSIDGSYGGGERSVPKLPGKLPGTPPKEEVIDVFPDDIVKPNPGFGDASSPVPQKIGVLNEDSEERADNTVQTIFPEAEVKTIPE